MRSMSGLEPMEAPAVVTPSSFFSAPVEQVAPAHVISAASILQAKPKISAASILQAKPVISAQSILSANKVAQPAESAHDSAVQHTLELLKGKTAPVAA
jgi:hypothetical protein